MENIIGRTKTVIKEFTDNGILFNNDFKLFDMFICNRRNANIQIIITDGEIAKTLAIVEPESDLSLNFGVGLEGWKGARLQIFIPEIEDEEMMDEGMVYVTANYLEITGQHYSVWRN
jgi:hypothetical protein